MVKAITPFLLAGFLLALPVPTADGCPFCGSQGRTLTQDVTQAAFVVYGKLSNALPGRDGEDSGTTDMDVEDVVKAHPYVQGKKKIVLPRFLPLAGQDPNVRFLVFCDLFRDRLDPYRGMPVKDKEMVTYLKGAMTLDEKDVPRRLLFFFDYLDHADVEIGMDAYKEFANADSAEVQKAVAQSDKTRWQAKLSRWLHDPETPTYRYGLYGYLLGMVGGPKDADVLLDLLNDPKRGLVSGVDGVLAGLVTLQPKQGWQYVRSILDNGSADFMRRYAALRTVRFFWDYRPDVIDRKDLVAALKPLLDQADIADLAVDDLRKRAQWQLAEQVLDLAQRPSHNVPIMQRAILRFALSCPPAVPRAAAFVEQQRKTHPEKVKDVEELLKLEDPPTPPPATPAKPNATAPGNP